MRIEVELPEDMVLIVLCPHKMRAVRPKEADGWFIQIESLETVDRRWQVGIGPTPQEAADAAITALRADIEKRGKALYNVTRESEVQLDLGFLLDL